MTTTRKHTIITSLALLAVFAGTVALPQEESPVPITFNYQGRLVDGTTLVNGTKEMTFRIYEYVGTNEFGMGDYPYYAQTSTVTVVDGLFSVSIGGQTNDMMAGDFPLSFLADSPMMEQSNWWLEVSVDGVALEPREPIRSVPYALVARTVPYNSITEMQIANNAVGSYQILNGSITHEDIRDRTIRFADMWFNYATNGQIMKYNGAVWVASDDLTSGPGGSGTSDHGSLDGLTDPDDHPQYLRSDGYDTFGGTILSIGTESTLDVKGNLIADHTVVNNLQVRADPVLGHASIGFESVEYLQWDVGDARFEFSEGLFVGGDLQAHDNLLVRGFLELGNGTPTIALGEGDLYVADDAEVGDDLLVGGYIQSKSDASIGGGSALAGGNAEWFAINGRSDSWRLAVQNEATEAESDFFIGLSSTEDGIFHIENDGDVGIGTHSPLGKLHVTGGPLAVGSTATRDDATGDGDLYVADTAEIDGELNVAGTADLDGELSVRQAAVFNDDVTVYGDLTARKDILVHDNLTVHDDVTALYRMTVGNGTPDEPYESGDVYVTHDVVVGGALKVGSGTPGGNFDDAGDAYVTGDLKVGDDIQVVGIYSGSFPTPAYDSGWRAIAREQNLALTHNLGGDVDDYVVDLSFKDTDDGHGINNRFMGGVYDDGEAGDFEEYYAGGCYRLLTSSQITLHRFQDDSMANQIRVRIWVYKTSSSKAASVPAPLSIGAEEPVSVEDTYDGVVGLDADGQAVVVLPAGFEAQNRAFRYQLTCIGGFAPVYVAEEIADDRFKIAGGKADLKVSWLVTAK